MTPSTLDAESTDAEPIDDPRKDVLELVHPVIQRVLEDSESATLAVGENLAEIVTTAEEFVEVLRSSVGVMGSSGEGSISHSLDLQSAATDAYVGDLRAVITDNSLIAERVIETTGAVSSAAQAVSEIASAARMLCFNTKIEAGRLGDLGRPFMVIADQMRALSEAIAESNDHISELTGTLSPLLGEVKSSAHALEGRTDEFTALFARHREGIQSMSRDLQSTTSGAMAEGDRRLSDILARSADSLVALQIQDVISQRLRKVRSQLQSMDEGEDNQSGENAFLSDDLDPNKETMDAGAMELF